MGSAWQPFCLCGGGCTAEHPARRDDEKWIFQLTKEQREEIVDTVFSMLDDAKIYTVDDFYNSKWKKVQELMKAKSRLSPETQELFSQALRMLWKPEIRR